MSEKSENKLNKEIKLVKDVYPSKRSINFIVDNEAKYNKLSVIVFGVFIVALLAFTKFGVIDTLTKTSALESNYNSYQSQIDTLNEQLSNYDEVSEKYNEIVGDFLTESEANSLNRMDIIDMLEKDVMSYVDITNFSVSGNQISVYTGVTDLNTVSRVLNVLQSDSRTSYVSISRTIANSDNSELVTADIEITYKDMEESK